MWAAQVEMDLEVHMSGAHGPTSKKKPAIYEIRVRGRLDEDWVEWFDDMTLIHTSEGHTLLSGPVPDQAALHGLLNKIRNLNLDLISVCRANDVTQVELNSQDES
jgi:hypothetical protein